MVPPARPAWLGQPPPWSRSRKLAPLATRAPGPSEDGSAGSQAAAGWEQMEVRLALDHLSLEETPWHLLHPSALGRRRLSPGRGVFTPSAGQSDAARPLAPQRAKWTTDWGFSRFPPGPASCPQLGRGKKPAWWVGSRAGVDGKRAVRGPWRGNGWTGQGHTPRPESGTWDGWELRGSLWTLACCGGRGLGVTQGWRHGGLAHLHVPRPQGTRPKQEDRDGLLSSWVGGLGSSWVRGPQDCAPHSEVPGGGSSGHRMGW